MYPRSFAPKYFLKSSLVNYWIRDHPRYWISAVLPLKLLFIQWYWCSKLVHPSIHPSSQFLPLIQWAEKRGTPWRGHQSVAGLIHNTFTPFGNLKSQINLTLLSVLWEETGVPGENPYKHREIEITREDSGFKPTTFLLITEKQKKSSEKKQQDFLLWTVTVKVDVKLIWLQFVAELRNCELWKCHASTLMYFTSPQKLLETIRQIKSTRFPPTLMYKD